MPDTTTPPGSLVLYKNRPARIVRAGEKLEIESEAGKTLKVRPKDVVLLHPGPLHTLGELQTPAGDLETAWELLAGSTTNLTELAELMYGDYTPAAAWAAWQLVAEGLYFRGTPEAVEVCSSEEVSRKLTAHEAKAAQQEAWVGFAARLRSGKVGPEDGCYLQEVEALALGQRSTSRALRELGRAENPEKAHALLLRLKHWDHTVNPHPQRLGLNLAPPAVKLPNLPDETRVDLTHLAAFAIDDPGSRDPDDALSLEGNRLWVHVADVAALIPIDSAADFEARARGANLYLPEVTLPMLPQQVTRLLGLGLTEVSPALSFGLDLGPTDDIVGVEVVPSWVRVTRLTYDEVDARLDEEPFKRFHGLAQAYTARRRDNGALSIELPEVKVLVQEGQVMLCPLPPLKSRALVQEAMLRAGEGAARYALEQGVPFPFTTQDPPEVRDLPDGLAGMFALRRSLKRSRQTSTPAPHAGLGLAVYARVTSPLRRCLDLVGHQQLRAHLRGRSILGEQEMLERVGAAEAVTDNVRRAELLANRHWTLVYLLQHPDWCGEGLLVEKRERRGTFLIPDLGLEIRLPVPENLPLNSAAPLVLRGVNLAELAVHFQVAD
ncbi:Ribonuclease R [Candidatus Entotheonellaceae bacterium PAL068K]